MASATRPHLRTSSTVSWWTTLALWVSFCLLLVSLIPARALTPTDAAFMVSMGLLGLWRWTWGGYHLLRAYVYTRVIFPVIRRRAEADPATQGRHVAVVLLSWKIGDRMNAAVFTNLFKDIQDYSGHGTVVAAISSQQDIEVISFVHRQIDHDGHIRLAFVMQDGTGKRSAMADALAKLRDMGVPPDCPGILMDGDTLVQPGLLRQTVPILLHQPKVGALTVDNTPLVSGAMIDREWYRLRMAQRHITMSSMAVSGKVLVLTGRWSMFRTQILTHPNFAATLLEDVIYHPRLGRITMLTGDDKSSWRWVVENGWDVTYVPDAVIYCLEALPGKGFLADTWGLQKRWFGNMVRGGIKALPLGPKKLGWFTYLALIDQKISMWTPLFGVIFFALASLLHDAAFIAVFLLWIALTRTLHSGLVGLIARRWHPVFPLLTYYGQIGGSLIKIFVNHNPNVQKWTRQSTGGDANARPRADSRLMMSASLIAFAAVVMILTNVTAGSARFDLRNTDYYADARQLP